MDFIRDYLAVVSGEKRAPSTLVAMLPKGAGRPEPDEVTRALALIRGVEQVEPREPVETDAGWDVEVRARIFGADRTLRIGCRPNGLGPLHLEWSRLTASQTVAARESEWGLGIEWTIGDEPLFDFHRQLKLLAALAPDAVVLADLNACGTHGGDWLRDMASSEVPPASKFMFTIHMVFEGDGPVWLHTHGLLRFGTFELEALDVPQSDAQAVSHLVNAVAAMFVKRKPPPPDEPFPAGRDLDVVWLPWQDGVTRVKKGLLGTGKDRDEYHSHPSAVLFAPGKKLLGRRRYGSLATYAKKLSDNPLLYVSSMETERMSLMAKERLGQFVALQKRHGSEDGWGFLVKLGYPMDDDADNREHLWFIVHDVREGEVDATLVNQPYHIARMHEGQRGWHKLELLSDWTIFSPRGRFGP